MYINRVFTNLSTFVKFNKNEDIEKKVKINEKETRRNDRQWN